MIDIIANYLLLGYEIAFTPYDENERVNRVILSKKHNGKIYSVFGLLDVDSFNEDNIIIILSNLDKSLTKEMK